MALTTAANPPLRRSFSEHVKDSTNKAWDVFWRSVRERRLWGESGSHVHTDYSDDRLLGRTFRNSKSMTAKNVPYSKSLSVRTLSADILDEQPRTCIDVPVGGTISDKSRL